MINVGKSDEDMIGACFRQAQRDAKREGGQMQFPNWGSCEVDWKKSRVTLVHDGDWAVVYDFTADRLGRVRFRVNDKASQRATKAQAA